MATASKKSAEKPKPKQPVRSDSTPRRSAKEEEVLKKSSYNVTTPRNYVQKSSTTDIYGRKKSAIDTARTPRKIIGTTHGSNTTPSQDFLKSSPSSISQLSVKSGNEKTPRIGAQKKIEPKIKASASVHSARKAPRTAKDLPFSNVTVNSPQTRRKLLLSTERSTKENKVLTSRLAKGDSKEINELPRSQTRILDQFGDRQRSKTRTLDEEEVKLLKSEVVDNNAEMKNLSMKLRAKPKAFYVELEKGNTKITEKQSDEEVSYEDDFESYESDFDSYHSDQTQSSNANKSELDGNDSNSNVSDNDHNSNDSDQDPKNDAQESKEALINGEHDNTFGEIVKESKDDEKMLDSGNFDLRDRSAGKFRPAAMEFILEDSEDDKKPSLPDEGFQDMSSSSAVSSMKTHVDVLDRDLFIDFSKSKESRRKRKINERLQQRAKDLLGMITLHEMSYTLFEMKPIPYDLYMATFGRSNYTQIAVQTFDDGITEEVQTEEIMFDHKWTQHPIDFSKHDVYLYPQNKDKKYGKNNEDYLAKFTFLMNKNSDDEIVNRINLDKSYKENPLRIYFEQKDGVGSCEMLPYEKYKRKMEENDFNVVKLRKFLKKVESRVSNILMSNTDENSVESTKTSKLPFSKGYSSILPNIAYNEQLEFLKSTKITRLIFSETKSNLIMSVHSKPSSNKGEKCVISLWDISVARQDPVKILAAVDNVNIGKFKGSTDGIFVAALEDGSLHLWDLSEKPTWRNEVTSDENAANLVEVNSDKLTQAERDREWNLKNSSIGMETHPLGFALQACSFTSSASSMTTGDVTDDVVGLEYMGEAQVSLDGARRVIGQVCSLQRIGMLVIWSIIQEKYSKEKNIGKAYWSKMALEKSQSINLLNYIDLPTKTMKNDEEIDKFNLNSAKRRLSGRRAQKVAIKKEITSPKSTSSSEFDISRPPSATSLKKVLSVEKKCHENWESGFVCSDLKILRVDKRDIYLIAKNNGEVLCCKKFARDVKVDRFCVTGDTAIVMCLDVSPHGLPYFLAATDSGTVNLCSLLDSRVLRTLDCRNVPPVETEVCQADHKGRFLASAKVTEPVQVVVDNKVGSKLPVTAVYWSGSNPCALWCMTADGAVTHWDLTRSDICAISFAPRAAVCAARGLNTAAILTPEGEIQIHRLTSEHANVHQLDLFRKYVTLL